MVSITAQVVLAYSGGTATITTADINGGAIDGTAIGASPANSGGYYTKHNR